MRWNGLSQRKLVVWMFESDSMTTVNAINRGGENYLEVDTVLQDCRTILSNCPQIYVSFVKKQAAPTC